MPTIELRRIAALLAAIILVSGPSLASAGNDGNRAIKGYGDFVPLPHAAVQPDRNTQYKAVFDITSGKTSKGVNAPLYHVARAVNVFASAGVPLKNLHFVAVIHSAATPIVLDNARYRKRYGKDNPNLKLIAELRAAGVKIEVCGQALADLHIDHAWVAKDVTITLSALSDNIIYGNKGYAYISM